MDSTTPGAQNNTGTSSRGKDQIHWAPPIWDSLDRATEHELRISRVAAKFLPHVYIEKKETTIAADQVNVPPQVARGVGAPLPDALNIDESLTTRINEYWIQFRLSPAQVEAESHAHNDATKDPHAGAGKPGDGGHPGGEHAGAHPGQAHPDGHNGGGLTGPHEHMMHAHHAASSGISLTTRAANMLALSEDLVLFNGANAITNSPLFTSGTVTALDPNIATNLDLGLLNIAANGQLGPILAARANQVIRVSPTQVIPAAGAVPAQYFYRENTLNQVARGVSVLQSLGHYEHYALVLNTRPYADLHQALPNTLITPIEPISHLIKAGVYGTGALPPFDGAQAGLPLVAEPNCIATGVLVSLSGNTMDHVRGKMDGHKDAVVSFNQKDLNEQYRFRIAERFALRLKDPSAFILFLFLNQ